MNDNDIIKAIAYCFDEISPCEGCPKFESNSCKTELLEAALDILNRQKAEIERLNHIRAELSKDIDELQKKKKKIK